MTQWLLPLTVLLVVGCAGNAGAGEPPRPVPSDTSDTMASSASDDTMTLFTFAAAQRQNWRVVNDGVMGGNSKGYLEIASGAEENAEGGTLLFTGTLVTQGGGFTSVRTDQAFDLSGYDGLELRVRGGGRTFQVEVDDDTPQRDLSRRAPFATSDDWQTVRVPFTALEATVRGEPVTVAPLDRASVERVGLFIADGQDGPFRLEVGAIRAYRAEE